MNKSFLSEEAKKRLIEILENKYPILVRRISQLDNDRIKLVFSVAESFRLPIDVMHDIEISKDVISAVIYLEQLANMFGSLTGGHRFESDYHHKKRHLRNVGASF